MIPIIMNTSFERIGEIDDYISFIWTTRYYKAGDFELCVPINSNTISLIQPNYYVLRDDAEEAGIIEKIELQKVENESEMMIVSGRFVSSIIGRRIIATQTQITNLTVPAAIQKLLNENLISPAISERAISNFSFDDESGYTGTITIQITGANLLEKIEGICNTYGLGFKVLIENGSFVFYLYQGVDRSYNQFANTYVVFSEANDNLESSDYAEDYQNVITDVLVAGEGEGLDRKTIWANKATNSGLNRYELYQDARNSSTNDGEISDSEYYSELQAEGIESITNYTSAFSGQVYFDGYEYGTDVNIGDIVTVENVRWGLSIDTRIVEVIESMSEAGEYTITPTFGVYQVGDESATALLTEAEETLLSERGVTLFYDE